MTQPWIVRHKTWGKMQKANFLVIDGPPDMNTALHAWPWLRAMPRPWRRGLSRLARPKSGLVAATADGRIKAYGLLLSGGFPPMRLAALLARLENELTPQAYGWLASGSSPLPGRPWRSGRFFGLLTALSPFVGKDLPFGAPEALTVLLQGEAQPELAVAARFLARRVRGLFIVCPPAYFRRNLAARILAESGLAVLDGPIPPPKGWDVAIDLRCLPPLFRVGPRLLTLYPVFPRPLVQAARWKKIMPLEHPVWAECHLACLLPEKKTLPSALTPASLRAAFSLLEEAGVGFAFA